MFGERRSGASFLSELIRTNVDPHQLVDCYLVTHHAPENEKARKHAPSHHHQHANARRPDTHHLLNLDESRDPTFTRHALVTKKSLEQMQCPIDETLFVYVTKDPYAWVNSMASRKTGGPPRRTVVRDIVAEKFKTSSESYGNLLQMRYEKIKSSLKLRDSVKHFVHVRYEDFLEDAEVNLSEVRAERPRFLQLDRPFLTPQSRYSAHRSCCRNSASRAGLSTTACITPLAGRSARPRAW